MTLSGPLIGSIIFAWGAMILIALWPQLKAIRAILADIAKIDLGKDF